MIKILITDKLAKEGIDLLNSIDGVQAVVKTGISEDELAKIIGEHDGLLLILLHVLLLQTSRQRPWRVYIHYHLLSSISLLS